MDELRYLRILGAAQHNLKSVNLDVPKNSLVVFTGVSGSGKSSMAFDTIFAEGQRRYIESLSAYARQFLGQIERPRFERISGLAPTVAIEQKSASSNPRSTVGTVTEVVDYLRVLFARLGEQRCHQCGAGVESRSAQEIVTRISGLPEGSRVVLSVPLVTRRKGRHEELFKDLLAQGFMRFVIDGELYRLDEVPNLDKARPHDISVVVDRVQVKASGTPRLADSVETCLKVGKGMMTVQVEEQAPIFFSEKLYCPVCDLSLPEPSPQLFSFNNPHGACPTCKGLGETLTPDPARIVPKPEISVNGGAIALWASFRMSPDSWTREIVSQLARYHGMDLDQPFGEMPKAHQDIILWGSTEGVPAKMLRRNGPPVEAISFEGVANTIERRLHETQSEAMRRFYAGFMASRPCRDCEGTRLRPEARSVFLGGHSITDMCRMTVDRLVPIMDSLPVEGHRREIARVPLREVAGRLGFLLKVGLGYMTLERSAESLSGGEAQRIRLAGQLGTELSGVIYVLDEPSIGLHARDNGRLIETLKGLRDLGNSVVVVEHDRETMESADYLVDFGPGAGRKGGEVVFSGLPADILKCPESLTGAYLSGRRQMPVPPTRRSPKGWIEIKGARQNNLKGIDVRFPLGVFCTVTGVSGAGKSSLITETLKPALLRHFYSSTAEVGQHDRLLGLEQLDKVISIDQKPIGRTPRSNPATYTKVFDHIREVFAQTREARAFGYGAGRFSFNVKGGRCERCQGAGVLRVEMHFLPDVFVTCPVCEGKRFNDATLRVRFRDHDIHQILEATVEEAAELFSAFGPVRKVLQTLMDVGLGYIQLGQSSTTLSGGEAQRIKLSRELAKSETGRTLYLLDEPTSGLHFEDIRRLLGVIDRLVDKGNTVLVIEHNLDVVRASDFVLDVGPEGGDKGGRLVGFGTPEELPSCKESITGRFL
jgi:excinuclease ABC subunit A